MVCGRVEADGEAQAASEEESQPRQEAELRARLTAAPERTTLDEAA